MKLLMITPYLPYPPVSGGQTRSYHLLRRLSKRHDITLFCYYRKEEEKKYLEDLKPYVNKIVLIKRRSVIHPFHFFLSLATTMPFLLVSIYYSRKLHNEIKKELSKNKYDLIHCETFYITPNVPNTNIPIILVEQTIEYYVYEHFVKNLPFYMRPFFWIELKKLLYWERKIWRRAVRILTVSEEDKKIVMDMDNQKESKLDVVPNGTDADAFDSIIKKPLINRAPIFLYVGNFKWLQNTEALGFLVKKIWPLLKKEYKSAQLIVAGKNIPYKFMKRHRDVILYESVPDIRDIYRMSDILIAPLFGPGGTRLKILEAMANKVVVATTPVGAMGLNIRDGHETIIFNSAGELISKLRFVINSADRLNRIIKAAYDHVSARYSWSAVVERLEYNYKIALKQHENSN